MSELRAVLRSHLRHPAVLAATALSVGVGVGAATLLFSLVHMLLMRPLDVPEAEVVFRLSRDVSGEAIFSYPEVEAIRRVTAGRAQVVGHQVNEVVMRWGDGPPATAWFEIVEPSYFETFDVPFAIGAGFSGAEAPREVIVSHGLWERRGEDPGLIGRTVSINGEPFTVVGVAAEGFGGLLPGVPVEIWLPLRAQPVALPGSGSLEVASDRFLVVTGRLSPEVSLAELQGMVRTASVDGADPAWSGQIVAQRASGLLPLLQAGLRPIFSFLSIMFATVVLIACGNVAGLLLAQGTERLPELSTRLALGATPTRLLGNAAGEALVLAIPGATAAVIVGAVGTRLIASISLPAGVPIVLEPRIDAPVLAFALAVSLVATLLAAIGPAWIAARRATRWGWIPVGAGHRGALTRRLFVGVQTGLTTVLLAVSALVARGIERVGAVDPGFRVDGVVTVEASADHLGYDVARLRDVWEEAVSEVRAVSGVLEAGAILFAPMGSRSDRIVVAAPGTSWVPRPVLYNTVTGGSLEALDLTVVRGRGLTDVDGRSTGPIPVLLNETLAVQAFEGGDPLARLLEWDWGGATVEGQVVGVVRDATYRTLGEGSTPHIYLPFGRAVRGDMMIVAHTERPLVEIAPVLAASVRSLDPDLVVTARTMAEAVDESTFWSRMVGSGMVTAGLGGLLLAVVGLFASVSYEARRRLREIAIRRALGASDRRARSVLLIGTLRATTIAIAIGMAGAVFVGGLTRALLHGVPPHDPGTLAGVASALLVVVVAATAPPATKALRTQPAELLKED